MHICDPYCKDLLAKSIPAESRFTFPGEVARIIVLRLESAGECTCPVQVIKKISIQYTPVFSVLFILILFDIQYDEILLPSCWDLYLRVWACLPAIAREMQGSGNPLHMQRIKKQHPCQL